MDGTCRAPDCVDVAIAGGGLGGLALAAGLARHGFDVHVFEAASELRTATATLIGLGGNAFTSLEGLHPDIVPQIKAKGSHVACTRRFVRASKDHAPQEDSSTPPTDLYTIRWSTVQNVLASLVPAERVHCQYRATGYTECPQDGYVRVHFKGQEDVKARLLVGADGVRSAIRATMIPNDPGPRYLGHMNWNAVVYNPGGSVVNVHKPDEMRTFIDVNPAVSKDFFKHMAYLIDSGGGYSFWQLRSEFPEPSFTPPPTTAPAAPAPAGPDDSPDAPTDLHKESLSAETVKGEDDNKSVYLAGAGLGKPGSKARVVRMLKELGWDDLRRIVEATPESDIFERAMIDRVPLDTIDASMVSRGGRVVIIGDAAHAMHSGPGQGARTAFEDAHMLLTHLLTHRNGFIDWSDTSGTTTPTDAAAVATPAMDALSLSHFPQDVASPTAVTVVSAPGEKGVHLEKREGVGHGASDSEALHAALHAWSDQRLARVCRIQRFAAEGCGLPALRDELRPKDVLPAERVKRFTEFSRWLALYPECPTGDPDSTYWKPVVSEAAVQQPVL